MTCAPHHRRVSLASTQSDLRLPADPFPSIAQGLPACQHCNSQTCRQATVRLTSVRVCDALRSGNDVSMCHCCCVVPLGRIHDVTSLKELCSVTIRDEIVLHSYTGPCLPTRRHQKTLIEIPVFTSTRSRGSISTKMRTLARSSSGRAVPGFLWYERGDFGSNSQRSTTT